jgi:nitrate/nitrite transporter NarK
MPEPHILRTCVIPRKPSSLIGVWASMVAFDVYAFVLTLWNAAERPRPVRVELVQTLKRDGIAFFVVCACFIYLFYFGGFVFGLYCMGLCRELCSD